MIVQTTGKQISYWMDYDNFLSLSQKALDLGCTIVKEYLDQGRVYNSLAPSTKIPPASPSSINPATNYPTPPLFFSLQRGQHFPKNAAPTDTQRVRGREGEVGMRMQGVRESCGLGSGVKREIACV